VPGVESEGEIFYPRETYPPLSREQEKELIAQYQKLGDEKALEILIRSNLRFVISVCRQEFMGQGMTLPELVSEGVLGLLEGIQRFDPTRGRKLITYAVWWIRQSVRKALKENRTVRHPDNVHLNAMRLNRTWAERERTLQRAVRREEAIEAAGLTPFQLHSVDSYLQPEISTDAPAFPSKESSKSWGEFHLEDPTAEEEITERVDQEDLSASIENALDVLDGRSKWVVMNYYGLGGRSPQTLEELGKMLGVTRERVRQIKKKALKRIRRLRGGQLLDFAAHLIEPPNGERERIECAEVAIEEYEKELQAHARGTLVEEVAAEIREVEERHGVALQTRFPLA